VFTQAGLVRCFDLEINKTPSLCGDDGYNAETQHEGAYLINLIESNGVPNSS